MYIQVKIVPQQPWQRQMHSEFTKSEKIVAVPIATVYPDSATQQSIIPATEKRPHIIVSDATNKVPYTDK